ncbi:MAG: BrnA antitoxin family protein [Magnetococcales bacterium]|nr:BrnA antitoxin family protein [Magnetococcales bacterium]
MSIKPDPIMPTDEEDQAITAAAESDPDNPIWTDDDFARACPAAEVHPEIVAEYRRQKGKRGRPRLKNPKQVIAIRLDHDLVDAMRATGPGWQTRVNEVLRTAYGLELNK